jgi:glutathione S-transferase
MLARENLHLQDRIPLRNVTEDPKAKEDLVRLTGKDQAPCLIVEGKPMQDSDEIVRYLVEGAADVG